MGDSTIPPVSKEKCEEYAREGYYNIVGEAKAQSCQDQFPDEFVMKDYSTGRHGIHLWYVTYKHWGPWFDSIFPEEKK